MSGSSGCMVCCTTKEVQPNVRFRRCLKLIKFKLSNCSILFLILRLPAGNCQHIHCAKTKGRDYQDVQCVLGLLAGIFRTSSVSLDYRQELSGRPVCPRTTDRDCQDVQCILGLPTGVIRTSSVS